jgi:hypothetical protein
MTSSTRVCDARRFDHDRIVHPPGRRADVGLSSRFRMRLSCGNNRARQGLVAGDGDRAATNHAAGDHQEGWKRAVFKGPHCELIEIEWP